MEGIDSERLFLPSSSFGCRTGAALHKSQALLFLQILVRKTFFFSAPKSHASEIQILLFHFHLVSQILSVYLNSTAVVSLIRRDVLYSILIS